MDFLTVAKERYSVRNYQAKAVENEKIQKILEAGRVSPTAANKQPNHFLVLTDAQDMQKLSKAVNFHNAPLVIVVCADKDIAWMRPFDNASMIKIDASIATDHMMMCAQTLGLGSCWITYFDPNILRKEFNIPDNLVPVNILSLGYAAGTQTSPDRHSAARKPLDSMVHYGSF